MKIKAGWKLLLFMILLSSCTGQPEAAAPPVNAAPAREETAAGPPSLKEATVEAISGPDPWPPARGFGQLVHHPPTGSFLLFGGETNSRGSLFDTWIYDSGLRAWTEVAVEAAPGDVGGSTAAYDEESDRIIFYFSVRKDSSSPSGLEAISETWAFDMATRSWEMLRPSQSPAGLMGPRMVYDSESDRVILFGGADFTADQTTTFNQTWAYDYNTNTWEQMTPARAPAGRSYQGLAYSRPADRVYMYGGRIADEDQGQLEALWTYDYNQDAWQQVEYSGVAASDHHPFMVSSPRGEALYYLVGDQLQAFDVEGQTWMPVAQTPGGAKLHFHAMAVDSASGDIYVFGGGPQGLQYSGDLLIFHPAGAAWETPSD